MTTANAIWHITFGTYGSRLHGGDRPTVVRKQNKYGTPFVNPIPSLEAAARNRMKSAPVILNPQQRAFVESCLPELCHRGGWTHRTCAAATDHVHLLCDAPGQVHGKLIRALVKRWLTQALSSHFLKETHLQWWASGGSTKPVRDAAYLANVLAYIDAQRTTR